MNGKLLLCAIPFQMHDKLLPGVFTTTIRMKNFDISLVLCFAICLEVLVGIESVAFVFQEMVIGETSLVISKADIVMTTVKGSDRRWPP